MSRRPMPVGDDDRSASKYFVGYAELPEPVQWYADSRPDLRPVLARNANLHPDVFEAMYFTRTRPHVRLAEALLNRRLTDEQVERVLAVETRRDALCGLYSGGPYPLAVQEKMFHATTDVNVFGAWHRDGHVHPDLAEHVARCAGISALAQYLAQPEHTTEDVLRLMNEYTYAWDSAHTVTHVEYVLARHPQTLPLAVNAKSATIRAAAAASRHLTSSTDQRQLAGLTLQTPVDQFVTEALLNNPVLHDHVADEIRDRARQFPQAAWAKKARQPLETREGWTRPQQPWETESDPSALRTVLASVPLLNTRRNHHLQVDALTALAGNRHVRGSNLDSLGEQIASLPADVRGPVVEVFTATWPHRGDEVNEIIAAADGNDRKFRNRREPWNPTITSRSPASHLHERSRAAKTARWMSAELAAEPDKVWITVIELADGFPGTVSELIDAARLV
jgi:hypothetical protein